LKQVYLSMRIGFNWLRMWTVSAFCEYGRPTGDKRDFVILHTISFRRRALLRGIRSRDWQLDRLSVRVAVDTLKMEAVSVTN
jgi:hypothetical protein